MKNIKELRDDLVDIYMAVRKDAISHEEAKLASSTASKIISSLNAEMRYNKQIGQPGRVIKFLENGN